MFPIAAACFLATHAAPQWSPAPQPTGTLLRSATTLSDGRWFATDTSYKAWVSSDRGGAWEAFTNSKGTRYAWVFGDGVVVSTPSDENDFYDRYDPSSRSWHPMVFDRKLMSKDTAVKQTGTRWSKRKEGNYGLAIFRSDSVLAFRSVDSARNWKSIAALPNSAVTGGTSQNGSMFAGDRFWLRDTVKRVFRSFSGGDKWLEIPFPPVSALQYEVFDSLPGGKWLVLGLNSGKISGWETGDFGKNWNPHDLTTPDSIPGIRMAMSEGWNIGVAYRSDTGRVFAKQGESGKWNEIPRAVGTRFSLGFIAGGRMYAIGDSGLISLDLNELQGVPNRPRIRDAGFSWRWQDNSLVVEGVNAGEVWELSDLRGQTIATAKSGEAGDMRIHPSRPGKGLFLLRLVGAPSRSAAILVP